MAITKLGALKNVFEIRYLVVFDPPLLHGRGLLSRNAEVLEPEGVVPGRRVVPT